MLFWKLKRYTNISCEKGSTKSIPHPCFFFKIATGLCKSFCRHGQGPIYQPPLCFSALCVFVRRNKKNTNETGETRRVWIRLIRCKSWTTVKGDFFVFRKYFHRDMRDYSQTTINYQDKIELKYSCGSPTYFVSWLFHPNVQVPEFSKGPTPSGQKPRFVRTRNHSFNHWDFEMIISFLVYNSS